MTDKETANREGRITIKALVLVAIAWGILVCSVLAWQAYMYRGIFATVAEWQFREWGRMFPVATIAAITFLLELPLIIAIALKARRRRRNYGPAKAKFVSARDSLFGRIFAALGGVALVLAGILAVLGLTIGSLGDKPFADLPLEADADLSGSFVRTRALVRMDRIGYYRERFVVTGRDLWVAPVTLSQEDRTIRAFVQVPPVREASEAQVMEVSGVARRAALPGGLRRLYENEGYSVARPAYVIFSSRPSARWPFFSAAADLAIAALLFFLTFGAFRAHERRMKRREAEAGKPA